MRGKIHVRKRGGRTKNTKLGKVKIRYLVLAMLAASAALIPHWQTRAEKCPELNIVFARGSGGERWTSEGYLAFKSSLETKLATTSIDYKIEDLDYPAVGVGMGHFDTALGAYASGGEAYDFGDSMKLGITNLKKIIKKCPDSKYVLGGYSQGAMVVLNTMTSLRPEQLAYVATFGDPKIYLPEGRGVIPPACRGENLSDYRMYVPDCRAYKGILGAYIPYEPDAYKGKVGTWCNKRDVLCSSYYVIDDHVGYAREGLYEDASRVIFDKVAKMFGIENHISSPHDTAILIDSTDSMMSMIDEYKAEALRLATETLKSGGRVALYDYRDLDDPYDLVKHCDFEGCTLEVFQRELENIQTDGGGDTPESLLSASFHTMKDLHWRQGSTKSLVILTDADFLFPDRDGMTFDEVVALSKRIDPVNFYVITNTEYSYAYAELASATDGLVVTDFDKLDLLTDYIMERYDSLPRVEEMGAPTELPIITVTETEQKSDTEVTVRFTNTGTRALVVLNDYVLGVTERNEVTIGGLDTSVANAVTLVPLGNEVRGEGVTVEINDGWGRGGVDFGTGVSTDAYTGAGAGVIKAPNAGGR